VSETPFPVAILAGGLATRLRPVTETIPKSLVDVNGEPFIYHQLRLLRASGVERVVVCVGYLGDMIEEQVGNGGQFDLQVGYSSDGQHLLGTAGAIKRAVPLLGDAFFVLYGDSYLPCDYASVERVFIARACLALMTVMRNEGRWDTSNVEFADGRIIEYDKARPTTRMRHIDYGLGALRREAIDLVPSDEPRDLAWLYQDLLRRGELAAFEVDQRFFEIGSFRGLEETRRHLASAPYGGRREE
jgi:NDP-sugar pyrophosphorylase family protein